MNRRRARRAALLAMTVLMTVALTAGAHAAPGEFGPPEAVCIRGLSAVVGGTLYAAGDCSGGVALSVRRPAASWHRSASFWMGMHVEAVAADDTATFVLVSCLPTADGKCPAPPPDGRDYFVGKIPHGGSPSALTLVGSSESSGPATIAARGGRWWAAWTTTYRDYDRPGSGSQTVMWQKTYGGAARGSVPVPRDPTGARTFSSSPSIALTGSGAEIAFITQVDLAGAQSQLQLATAGADGAFTTQAYGPAAGAPAMAPDIAYSGGRTFVAWARDSRPAVAFERDGRLQRIDVPHRGDVVPEGVAVTASGGLLTLTTAETFTYQGSLTRRVYVRSISAAGDVGAARELTAGAARTAPHLWGRVLDATAVGGKASVAYSDGTRAWVVRQG